ncbi:hypothetical protein OXE08_004533 [Salmonella enterica]|nr:hypothetical protein [Salmonella enterica]
MSKSNVVGGGVVVALVIAGKLALKAGIIAALFGGSVAASNAYQSRVDEVKQKAEIFNREHTNQHVTIDEVNRVYTIHMFDNSVKDEDLNVIKADAKATNELARELAPAIEQDKQTNIKQIVDTKDSYSNYFLISQGWKEVLSYETYSGNQFAQITITSGDLY